MNQENNFFVTNKQSFSQQSFDFLIGRLVGDSVIQLFSHPVKSIGHLVCQLLQQSFS
jgi:hypothetical protein